MSEFLKRETHLRKINEELNKMPNSNLNQTSPTAPVKTNAKSLPDSTRFVRWTAAARLAQIKRQDANKNNNNSNMNNNTNHNNNSTSSKAPIKTGNTTNRRNAVPTNGTDSKKKSAEPPVPLKSKIFNKTTSPVAAKKDNNNEDGKKTERHTGTRQPMIISKDLGSLYKDARENSYVIEETYINRQFLESPSLIDFVRNGTSSPADEKYYSCPRITTTSSTLAESHASTTTSVGTCTDPCPDRPALKPSVKLSNGQRISSEGILQFLKSKVSILQEELETHTQDILKKNQDLAKAYDRQKKLEAQRDQVFAKNSTLSENIIKMETKVESIEKINKDRETELSLANKALEALKRDHKILRQSNINLETRLERTTQQLDAANNCITQLKVAAKETRETVRADKINKDKQVKMLHRRNSELLVAYRKQLFLIDNLKQQVSCHESFKKASYNEKEFGSILRATELEY